MNTRNFFSTLLLAVGIPSALHGVCNPWKEMDQVFDEFHRHAEKMNHLLQHWEEEPPRAENFSFKVQETDEGIEVTLPLDSAKGSKAKVTYNEEGDGYTHVTIPQQHGFLRFVFTPYLISVDERYTEEVRNKEKSFLSNAHSSYAKSLSRRIDPSSVQAEYQDNQLKLSFAEKKLGKNIAIKGQPVTQSLGSPSPVFSNEETDCIK